MEVLDLIWTGNRQFVTCVPREDDVEVSCFVWDKLVARDGIEPPTPAFSGLRSSPVCRLTGGQHAARCRLVPENGSVPVVCNCRSVTGLFHSF